MTQIDLRYYLLRGKNCTLALPKYYSPIYIDDMKSNPDDF
jgi:hypothetical protein